MNNQWLRARLVDVFAGVICSTLAITTALSYAALIFSGPLLSHLPYGIAVTFLSAAIAGAVVTLGSSFRFAIAGPDGSIAVVLSVLLAKVAVEFSGNGNADPLGPVLVVMALTTALTGLLLFSLGFTRAARAIRFVPYPVIGGFLGATGWMMIAGAIPVMTGEPVSPTNVAVFFSSLAGAKLAAGLAVTLTLVLLPRRFKSPFIVPGVLLAAVAITHLALMASGSPIATAQSNGWLFRQQATAALMLPWKLDTLLNFPWKLLPALVVDILAVMFVTTSNLLFNMTGIEMATQTEANIERDLKAVGVANLLISATGGYIGCTSLSRSTLVHFAGARSRLAGLTVAAILAAMLAAGTGFLGYVPRYAIGGLLVWIGGQMAYEWLLASYRRLLIKDYLLLITIAVLIVGWGFVAGVLIGVVISCGTFALSASRVNVVKFDFDGSEYRSPFGRALHDLALLAAHGQEIQGMTLQGYLFFGSADRLYRQVQDLLTRQPRCRFLIFDFHLVTGIDSSATHSFEQIKRAAGRNGADIVLVGLTGEPERAFQTAGLFSGNATAAWNLDQVWESCEQAVIESHRSKEHDAESSHAWLSDALGSPLHADCLLEYCRRIEVQPGEVVAHQDGASDTMYFILSGRLGVMIAAGDGPMVRIRSLGRHTTIGETGLMARQPRTATIQAETASVLYELSVDSFERLKLEHPALGQALLGYVIAVMAERLNFTTRTIGMLRR